MNDCVANQTGTATGVGGTNAERPGGDRRRLEESTGVGKAAEGAPAGTDRQAVAAVQTLARERATDANG
jgi:hypothetical protein